MWAYIHLLPILCRTGGAGGYWCIHRIRVANLPARGYSVARQLGRVEDRRVDIFLQTPRLVLRPFTDDDVDLLIELDSDPEVMRYLGNGRPTPPERIISTVHPHFVKHPDQYFAAYETQSDTFIGWFELAYKPDVGPRDRELGYRLRRAAWGKGYATEGSRALIEKAFTELGVDRVWAETMAVNTASRRVMEKAGLRYVRTYHTEWDEPIPGTEHGEVVYELHRADWETARHSGSDNAIGHGS